MTLKSIMWRIPNWVEDSTWWILKNCGIPKSWILERRLTEFDSEGWHDFLSVQVVESSTQFDTVDFYRFKSSNLHVSQKFEINVCKIWFNIQILKK